MAGDADVTGNVNSLRVSIFALYTRTRIQSLDFALGVNEKIDRRILRPWLDAEIPYNPWYAPIKTGPYGFFCMDRVLVLFVVVLQHVFANSSNDVALRSDLLVLETLQA